MIEGSCLCGGVKFEADEIAITTYCHCSMCRKALGAAFGTFAHAEPEKFRYRKGEDLITRYESSPGNHRGFCRVCGSSVPVRNDRRVSVPIPAGCLDGDPELRPVLHIFTGSKAPWWTIDDGLPQFEAAVPGYSTERPAPASERTE